MIGGLGLIVEVALIVEVQKVSDLLLVMTEENLSQKCALSEFAEGNWFPCGVSFLKQVKFQRRRRAMKKTTFFLILVLCLAILSATTFAADKKVEKSCGQTVYVGAPYADLPPAGNIISHTQRWTQFTIRNTDPSKPIYLKSVRFYSPDGESVKELVDEESPEEIGSLQSKA